MKRYGLHIVGLAAALGLLFPMLSASALEAGAAKVEITPPIGTPLNGYGDRMGRNSTGVHDPLWARALFLDDGETRLMLVNVDLCVINPALRARVLELAPEAVPKEHIILVATHTHNGHGAMVQELPFRIVSGRFIPEVLEESARKIAAAMRAAFEARRRAAIGYGVAKQTVLSANRRDKDGPIDEQIGVIGVEDADGNSIAILSNFAAHPTSVGGEDQYSFSADYPGYYYNEIERLAEEGCIALFLNGAQGNQTIANPENKAGWERTESVGRLLAMRAKEVINTMTCTDATLTLNYRTADLPPSLATFQPKQVLLQSLEINDLLINFLPGETCVEIGLELRKRALARGYKAHFTVSLANDFLMYFAPLTYYHRSVYESAQHYFGPGMEQWIYRQCERMMTRGEAPPESPPPPQVQAQEIPGGLHIRLEGPSFTMGQQRGQAFRTDIKQRYQDRIVNRIQSGALKPASGIWSMWPGMLDPTPLALPVMGMAARPLLTGLSEELMLELQGMAQGADLPFDALWLLQNAALFAAQEDTAPLFHAPLCTMFALSGDRAGADTLLIGRNLDWPETEIPLITEMHPEEGHAFIQVGFTWNAGAFSGMNDAGLVLCVESSPQPLPPTLDGLPLEMLLRSLLQEESDLDKAVARLQSIDYLEGYHVLVAGKTKTGPQTKVVSVGKNSLVRDQEEGLLIGLNPETCRGDDPAKARYKRLLSLLQDERILGKEEIKTILGDMEAGKSGLERIRNPLTQHSIIFEPLKKRMHIAFPTAGQEAPSYTTLSLAQGGSSHE